MILLIEASDPRRIKQHMEAAWVSIANDKPHDIYNMSGYSIRVVKHPDGSFETSEIVP